MIERKSHDFLDFKRLKMQASIMKNAYGENAYLVVEHNLDDLIKESKQYFQRDKTTHILGMVASLAEREKLVPIFCSNQQYAAYIIKSLCFKGNDGRVSDVKISKPRSKKLDYQIHFLCGLPGVEEEIAKRLLDKFGTVQNLVNATKEDLQEVERIGKVKAENIYKVLR